MGVLVGVVFALVFLGMVVQVLLFVGHTSFCFSWIIVISCPLLFLEIGGLTLLLYCWYLICSMGLVIIVVPTTVLELTKNSGLYGAECDSRNCLLPLDIICHDMIPFRGDHVQQHHSLNILRDHNLVAQPEGTLSRWIELSYPSQD